MKRRSFVKLTAPMLGSILGNGLTPQVLGGLGLSAALSCDYEDRAIVIIQLSGGNDGLNMLVPIDQYDTYRTLRPTIGLKDTGSNAFINLDSTLPSEGHLGLHPTMTGLKDLYDQGKVKIIQGVAYPNLNRSHFTGVDVWLRGNDGLQSSTKYHTSWLGRYIKEAYPNLIGRPTPEKPDPLGIRLNGSSFAFYTDGEYSAEIKLDKDVSTYHTRVLESSTPPPINIPSTNYGDELNYILGVEAFAQNYSQRVSETFNNGINTITYPNNSLADQLKTVARLISGGCKSKIFYTQIGGFDTHGGQVDPANPATGAHAQLLFKLSASVKAFQDDLANQSLDHRVLTSTFSEFGRTAPQNGSFGTGHGKSAPLMVIGKGVNPGVLGDVPTLSDLAYYWDLIQYDYRSIFTSLLQDWLGADSSILNAIGFGNFINQKPPIVASNMVINPTCYFKP